jgi:alkylation response protein AidB-like acyl-CoA dehydrogenase
MTVMDLTHREDTPEQSALRESVRHLAGRHPDRSAWKHLSEGMGLTALAVPEGLGGAGGSWAEVAVVVEETGRVLLPVPYLSTALGAAVLAEGVLADEASVDAAALLSRLVTGAGMAALATDADVVESGGRVSGRARHVLDGAPADVLVVRAGDTMHAVRAADAGVTPVGTLDETRTQATVEFRDVPAVALGVAADRVEQLVQVMLAVESVAAAEHCLGATVEYLKTRVQFGRPIGTFQSLRHRCADLAVEVVAAGATAQAAVRAATLAPSELPVLAPLAKRYCAEVFLHVAGEMIQLHGGIGFTWEHDAHRYFKRAKTTQLLHGSPVELRRLVAQRAGLTA